MLKIVRNFTLLILTLTVVTALYASAADVYITQNTSGGDTGADCTNAHSASWFNSNATGGNTYHLCGTFNGTNGQNMLISPAGSSGNILTILFEPGAVMTATYWGSNDGNFPTGGAITVNNFVTVDGGTNGIIQNTVNGAAGTSCPGGTCSDHISGGIYIPSGKNSVEIKNLTIQNIFLCNSSSKCNSVYSSGIKSSGSHSNISIHDNTITGTAVGIYSEFSGSALSNVNYFNNTLSDLYWGINIGSGSAGNTTSDVNVFRNTISNLDTWEHTPVHEDGMILFSTSKANVFNVYNNNISAHGNLTANIFCTYGASAPGASCNIFNNVLYVDNSTCAAVGGGRAIWLHGGSGPHVLLNNTMVGPNASSCPLIMMESPTSIATFQNNILTVGHVGLEDEQSFTSNLTTSDYNLYFNLGFAGNEDSSSKYYSFPQWQTLGFDAHGITGDPKLNKIYQLQSGSAAIGAATNLTSICSGQPVPGLGALCQDKNGASRPSTGAWDAGAIQYSSVTVAAPTGLTAVAR